jgi:hypothetical protein
VALARQRARLTQGSARDLAANCAWDGLGIVAALGLRDATVTSGGLRTEDDVVFHVEVPARDWWADIGHT